MTATPVPTLDSVAVGELAAELAGELIRSGDPAYDEARRVWNGMIDRRPTLVARCRGVADVVACVRFAAEHNLLLAVRGGLDRHPQLAGFLQRIHARPAYQRALAQGGPFTLAGG